MGQNFIGFSSLWGTKKNVIEFCQKYDPKEQGVGIKYILNSSYHFATFVILVYP